MSYSLAVWIVVLSHLSLTFASPIYAPQFLSGGTGRNIRHLPCVSLRTGETGVCMFAFTCVKSNGTHLGTCIDRFYFGSCCKLNEDADVHPQDNAIDDASSSSSYVTTGSAQDSNDISDFFNRVKPIQEKTETSTSSTGGQTALTTKQQTIKQEITTTTTTSTTTARPTTTTTTKATTTTTATTILPTTQKIFTKRPTFFSTPYTTTQPPIHLSTFQTSYDYSHGSSSSSSSNRRPISTSRPTTSDKNSTITETITSTTGSLKPEIIASSATQRPSLNPAITKKPTTAAPNKPTIIRRPVATSTTRPAASTTERTSTRFPPRNATTARPTHTTNTRKPIQQSTKKPTAVTKRPVTGSRRPTTKKPSVVSTTRPASTTEKTFSNIVNATETQKPTVLTSLQDDPTTFVTKPSSFETSNSRPSQRPLTTTPVTTNNVENIMTTLELTTLRPATTSTRPRPSSKPTRITGASAGRPTVVKTTPRPQQTSTEKYKTSTQTVVSSTSGSSSHSIPSTLKPTVSSFVKPKPTEKPHKTQKPGKPSSTTVSSSFAASTTTEASTVSFSSSSVNEASLVNEILPPKLPISIITTETTSQTVQPPGLVTWSSNSDDDVTKAPEVTASTSGSTHAATEPEWSPITTPDGWIMIQSPTTEKIPIHHGETTKPETTKITTTSEKPSVENATTERATTTSPTIPTILSTIAPVTAATDLPVPIETLNMSDYNQVCGRRLFPESRIVGGDHSSFGKWPWQISLRQWRTAAYLHKCGAALLNENWAITAAHCVENVPPSDLLLRIGEHDLANEDEPYGFQERRVQIVASHPQFDPRTFEYDLALLRFYEPVLPFQPNLLPICLPDDDENYVGHTAYVTGWGRLYEDGPLPSVLQEVSVPVVNNTVCEGMYRNAGYIEHIPHIFICAGWRKGGFDSCEGDSGGPMVIQRPRDKRWILAGVISWGIGCAEPNQPGVYTRISEFREWINQILQF